MHVYMGFTDSSVDKESACNPGDPSSIPGSGRSAGEGIDYFLQYSWASLMAQLVKNPPAMWETWVWSLGWGDALEEWKTTHSSILAWRILWTVWSLGSQRVGYNWLTFPFICISIRKWDASTFFYSHDCCLYLGFYFMAPKIFRVVYFCKKSYWNFDWDCGCMNI